MEYMDDTGAFVPKPITNSNGDASSSSADATKHSSHSEENPTS